MIDLTEGKVYDRVAMTWLDPEEFEERRAIARLKRQIGDNLPPHLRCPMYIPDQQGGIQGVKSMGDGKHYDSKSEMRKHYKRDGFVEVGNDSSNSEDAVMNRYADHKRPKTRAEKDAEQRGTMDSVEKAISRLNLTSYRKDEIT